MRVLLLGFAAIAAFGQMPCGGLKSLTLSKVAVGSAESDGKVCRVAAVLTPTADSHIEMEVWMPVSGWNGKFEAVGNGGWSGSINRAALAAAVADGYAAASTDTGHKNSETPGGSFALGHPEKLIDFGSRAVHETAVTSKAVIEKFYGKPANFAYWNSCSNGGRQGLMEAQKYPADFDGVVAGSPALDWTGRAVASLWVGQAVHKDEASYIPPAKYKAIAEAVLLECDRLDGIADGILNDPRACRFDPAVLLCKGPEDGSCLTAPQVAAARKIYSAAADARGREFYPGLAPGSELGWTTYAGPQPFAIGNEYGKYVWFKDTAWDYRGFDFIANAATAAQLDAGVVNATDPDLRAFFARGGKIVQYHGWSDPQIPPMHSVNYYRSVLEAMGGVEKVRDSYRLFMVPAMGHCGGGPGPNQFDALAAVERWREAGVAPDRITAAHVTGSKVDMTRPLCPYPSVAVYKGIGSTRDAENFACAAR